MRKILALVFSLCACAAQAQIVGTLPFILQNGTLADANQVMSDFNTIVAGVNANAATAGINTNINALNGRIGVSLPFDSSLAFTIEGGRHPVVEQALARDGGEKSHAFVANDCDLSPPPPPYPPPRGEGDREDNIG